MKIRTLTAEEAAFFCTKEEDQYFDRKSIEVSGAKAQKIAVAFANADGGEFVIGIKDEKEEPDRTRSWRGATRIEDFNGLLQALTGINPSVPMKYEALKCESCLGYALRVYVDKSPRVHNTADNSVYQRVGAQSIKISDPQKMIELSFAKGESTYEDKVIASTRLESVVDGVHIQQFLDDAFPRTDAIDFVSNTNLIDADTWEPRVCCLLLFHPNPATVLPSRCSVKIARYETKEDEPERDHLKDVYTRMALT